MSDGRSLAFYAVTGIIGFGILGLIKEVRRYPMEAESAGKQVRDRLGSSVVNPESDDLAEPSIYRDWPMVQKGYQSLREMNYNDDFDAEDIDEVAFDVERKLNTIARLEMEIVDEVIGELASMDVEVLANLFDIGTLIQLRMLAAREEGLELWQDESVQGYPSGVFQDAIWAHNEYNAEGKVRRHALDRFTKKRKPSKDSFRHRGRRSALKSMFANEAELKKGKVKAITGGDVKLRKLEKDKDLKPEDAIERLEISAESAYFIDVIVHNGHYWGDGAVEYDRIGPFADKSSAKKKLDQMLEGEAEEWEYHFEDQGPFSYKPASDGYMILTPATMSLEDFQYNHSMPTDKSIYNYDGMIYEAKITPVQMMSAEELMFNDWSKQEMMTHGDDDSFEDWLEHEIENHGNITLREWGDDEEKSHLERYGAEGDEQHLIVNIDGGWSIGKPDDLGIYPLDGSAGEWILTSDAQYIEDNLGEIISGLQQGNLAEWIAKTEGDDWKDELGAETFNAAVYRGRKPVSELGYAERAVMMDKMIEQARIEQSLLELEAAIKMGLITEDEIMKQLSEKFGSE